MASASTASPSPSVEILLPLTEKASADGTVTALLPFRVPVAQEATFLETLNTLLAKFEEVPGAEGHKVFRREEGELLEISVLQHFQTGEEHDRWLASPAFIQWRDALAPWLAGREKIRRYSGLESLFVTAAAPDAPPLWKMAVIMLLVTYPLSLVMSLWGAPLLATLPVAVGALITSLMMVILMTYVLVPALTRIFESWLQGK